MTTITLPAEFSYVLAVAAASGLVNVAHSLNTSKARKMAAIPYPTTYASDEKAKADPKAYAFNCAQRAHANFTENYVPFLSSLLISGLQYPTLAAGLGVMFLIGRIIYMRGYTTTPPGSNGRGRLTGAYLGGPSLYILQLTSLWTAVKMVIG